MFSGVNAPVANALVWCGWNVVPVDILFSPQHDLSAPTNQEYWKPAIRKADAVLWAIACDTMTRSRDIPLPGHSKAPAPLRHEGAVRGVPNLASKDQSRVTQANKFIDFAWSEVGLAVKDRRAAVVENPARSWLWRFQQAVEMHQHEEWQRRLYHACVHMGARRKAQAIETNVPELAWIEGECGHTHDPNEWDPSMSEDGTWYYPSSGEAEYTAQLAYNIAVALSWWAVRERGYRLPMPKPIPAAAAGNRVGWDQVPARLTRQDIMAGMATRAGLTAPEISPGA